VAASHSWPAGYDNVVASYRLSNNGTATYPHRLNLSLHYFYDESDLARAFYWDRDGSTAFHSLPVPSDYTFSASKAGTSSGLFVGETDGNGHGTGSTVVFPDYWANSSSWTQFFDSSYVTGTFWDVNASGIAVGTYIDGFGYQRPVKCD